MEGVSFICASIFIDAPTGATGALERAAAAVSHGARLIEWRIDDLAGDADAAKALSLLISRSPAPCIVTARSAVEGGRFQGDDAALANLVRSIAGLEHHPRYLDIEANRFRSSPAVRDAAAALKRRPAQPDAPTSVLLSVHDLLGRPRDLIQQIEWMTAEPLCDVIKVAWTARSLRDNLEAFELLRTRRKPMIALCMGPFGEMSRILAPKFGGLVTFASDAPGNETAPGQMTIERLRGLYRFDAIGARTRVFGVAGWPVAHSRSPHVHNAAFAATGEDAVYVPMPIAPGYEPFKATIASLIDEPRLDFRGASVTIPHKEHLLRFVKERGGRVDDASRRIGAANTLIVGPAGAVGCANTDAPAAVDALCAGMNFDRKELANRKVAILGAGGVARAVAVGCAEASANVIIFNRTQERARSLAAELSALELPGKVVPGKPGRVNCGCFDIIINCTSIGMEGGPAPHDSPLDLLAEDGPAAIDERVTVMDTVYTPRHTPLIKEAAARGAKAIPGTDMFIRQAALQFHLWTQRAAPLDVMRSALDAASVFRWNER